MALDVPLETSLVHHSVAWLVKEVATLNVPRSTRRPHITGPAVVYDHDRRFVQQLKRGRIWEPQSDPRRACRRPVEDALTTSISVTHIAINNHSVGRQKALRFRVR